MLSSAHNTRGPGRITQVTLMVPSRPFIHRIAENCRLEALSETELPVNGVLGSSEGPKEKTRREKGRSARPRPSIRQERGELPTASLIFATTSAGSCTSTIRRS